MRNLQDKEFVIFDVETTGLSYKGGDRVIEVAALKVKDMQIIDSYETLIDPERVVSYDAFLVNGISTEMLEGKPKADEILPSLLFFMGDSCLVGHNVRFDINFINQELALAGLPALNEDETLDTCRMAKGLLPHLQRYSLERVAYFLGYRKRQQHRALSDVHMTFAIFSKLFDIAQENNINNLNVLLDLFGVKKVTRQTASRKLKAISLSLEEKKPLDIVYASLNSGTTQRKITPRRLLGEGKQAVLVAYCHLRQEERYFNINKIVSLET